MSNISIMSTYIHLDEPRNIIPFVQEQMSVSTSTFPGTI